MADLNVLLQYAARVRDRLLTQQKSFSEKLQQAQSLWFGTVQSNLPLANYQIPAVLEPTMLYSIVAADSSPLELSRHRAVELKAVSLARVYTDYRLGSEQIERRIDDLYKDEVASLSNPLLELEYAVRNNRKVDLVLIDGSLIRWQWEQLVERTKKDLVEKYVALLQESTAPVFAIIDHSQSRDIIETIEKVEQVDLNNLVDEDLFELVLAPNTFSPVFQAHTPILQLHPEYKVGYVYYRASQGVLRVEFLLHKHLPDAAWACFIDQTLKGKGYPFMIARAHDACVVRRKDKFLLEQNLLKFGRMSQKERLKQLG